MKLRYLDYAAATPVDRRVFRAMRPYFGVTFGNPGSLHRAGSHALEALDRARETLAKAAGADFREVIFTASATEANNLALRGVVRAARHISRETDRLFAPAAKSGLDSRRVHSSGGRAERASETFRSKQAVPPHEVNILKPKIIISAVEHDSVLETARDMERAGEIELVVIPVDKRGVVDVTKLEQELDERTALVSVMYVNNEIGTVQPIAEISKMVRKFRDKKSSGRSEQGNWASDHYPLLHSDCAQAFLYYPCRMAELGVDLMTLSSQKIYGPKGAGALVGSLSALSPVLTGGGQEFGFRAGTENVPAVVGFAAAAAFAEKERVGNVRNASRARDAFVKKLKSEVPGVEENGKGGLPAGRQAPHIANLIFPEGVSSEDLIVLFDREGIAASPGAACSARALTLSHVLRAIGVPDERIARSIRFSFGRGVTPAAARTVARAVAKIVNSLKPLPAATKGAHVQ